MEKIKIEKDSVQETLIIPLYGRRLCSEIFPQLYQDRSAAEIMGKIDYDFTELERHSRSRMYVFGALEVAMRQNDIAWEIRNYLRRHPDAAVINLGCGLDDMSRVCDNGRCRFYNIDLPDVILMRERLIPAGEREKNLAFDLNDFAWTEAIDADPADGTILFVAGVFYYFTTVEVKHLFTALTKRFPGGRLVFDGAGPAAVKLMLRTWVKQAGIKNVGAYFSVRNAKEDLEPWSEQMSVSSRGYMQGYQKLSGFRVNPEYRLLARIADGPMHLQIVRIDFEEQSPPNMIKGKRGEEE